MIHLDCPGCGSELQLPDRRAGSVIRCPECEEQLRVPSPGPQPAETPTEAAPPALSRAPSTIGRGLVALLAVLPVGVALAAFYPGATQPQQPQAGRPLVETPTFEAPLAVAPDRAAVPSETEGTDDAAEHSR